MASGATTIASGGGLTDRYAAALYAHADEQHALDTVVSEMEGLGRLIDASTDFQRLLGSPLIDVHQATRAALAVLEQEGFSKLGAIAKRSGPLVGVIVQPADLDAAERVLAGVQYAGHLTLNEKVPVNEGLFLYKLFLNIFVLSGVLIGLSIIVGIGFGGFRIFRRKLGKPGDDDLIQLLRIGDK